MKLYEKCVSEETIYNGKVLNFKILTNELENNTLAKREIVEHPGGVCIASIDNDGYVYMVKQYRVPFNSILLEMPAGKLEPGEDILKAAKREYEEETGYIANKLTFIGEYYPSVGFLTEIIRLYIAEDLQKSKQNLDEDEFLNVEKYKLDDLYAMVMKNEIKDAKTVIAVMMLKNYLENRK